MALKTPRKPTPSKASASRTKAKSVRSGPKESEVKFSHEERVMFPEAGVTKGELLRYYALVAPKLVPHLKNRPMTLERLPEGVGDKSAPHFWQKNTPDYYPNWIGRIQLPSEEARPVKYALVNDKTSLLYLVNQGTITFHPWFSTVDNLDRPTFVLFDIDPHQSTFANAVKVAKVLHEILDAYGTESFVKTSGKSGLHVMTRWRRKGNFDQARQWAAGVAQRVVEKIPQIATTERHIENRGNRVYLDVEQNARGKHAIPPYIVRATPLATISMPLDWKQVNAKLDPKAFTIKSMMKRIQEMKKDPLAALAK